MGKLVLAAFFAPREKKHTGDRMPLSWGALSHRAGALRITRQGEKKKGKQKSAPDSDIDCIDLCIKSNFKKTQDSNRYFSKELVDKSSRDHALPAHNDTLAARPGFG